MSSPPLTLGNVGDLANHASLENQLSLKLSLLITGPCTASSSTTQAALSLSNLALMSLVFCLVRKPWYVGSGGSTGGRPPRKEVLLDSCDHDESDLKKLFLRSFVVDDAVKELRPAVLSGGRCSKCDVLGPLMLPLRSVSALPIEYTLVVQGCPVLWIRHASRQPTAAKMRMPPPIATASSQPRPRPEECLSCSLLTIVE
jgi:hypothetical protein